MVRLAKARDALQGARDDLAKMRSARDVRASEAAWISFLHALNRSYHKAYAELRTRSKYQGWTERGRVERLRSSDPLLSYLMNARDADEHGIERITNTVPGGIGINPAFGNYMFIEHMEMRAGKISIRSPQALRIDFIPPRIVLVPVVNKKVSYPVPTSHEGNPLANSDPVSLGECGCRFYETFFAKAEVEILR